MTSTPPAEPDANACVIPPDDAAPTPARTGPTPAERLAQALGTSVSRPPGTGSGTTGPADDDLDRGTVLP